MSSQLRLRRGSAAVHAVFTGAAAEVTVNTDDNVLIVHDGATPGGFRADRFIQAGAGALARTLQDKGRESVSVLDFGAKGDGVTNDTDAFAAAAAYIQSNNGGKLVIPPRTYIVGKQTLAGATGKGYAYLPADIISITGCGRPVVIEGQGAILKAAPGLKFGAFNPASGAAYAPAMPFTNADYAADIGPFIRVTGNASVTISGLELDGNMGAITLGGTWGDTGYQREAYGIRAFNNDSLHVEDVNSHHHGTDGIVIGWIGATVDMGERPHTLVNVKCEYNGRQALSWVGGYGLTAINCKFNFSAQGTFGSAPGAGVDIEAESAIIRAGVFINCEFGANGGYAMVADSGDSADVSFYNCRFYGTVQRALWPKKPRFRFYGCLVASGLVNAYIAANEEDRTRFVDCVFSANETFQGIPCTAGGGTYLADISGQNPIFERTTFVTNSPTTHLQASDNATYRNCTMRQNGAASQALPRGIFEGRNTITMSTGSVDMSGTTNFGQLNVSGTVYGANVTETGEIPAQNSAATWLLNLAVYNNAPVKKLGLYFQAPTSGTWSKGDRLYNNNPAVGAVKSWACTVSGTPGTWVSEGNL